jgi:hypothetical protein
MSCELGRTIQHEFDDAVVARAEVESRVDELSGNREFRAAKARESTALSKRAFHLHECAECWQRPPQ